jgi:hypothetical protein
MRRSSAQLFATVSDSAVKAPQNSRASLGFLETPIKKTHTTDLAHGHPIQSPRFDKENNQEFEGSKSAVQTTQKTSIDQEDCIYKSLGWEDDDIDDLA